MPNLATKGQSLVGDILLDVGKLEKFIRIRLGSGGTAAGTTATVVTGPYAVLPAQAVVYDAFLNVLTPSTGATKTLSVGTSGTPTGFLNGVSVASTGIALAVMTAATSGPGAGGRFWSTNTYGSLLSTFQAGTTAAGDQGVAAQKTYAADSNASRTLSFTPNSNDWVAFSADLYIAYVDLTK